jgi:hypothetical protein
MKLVKVILLGLVGAVIVRPASAQIQGMPVYFNPRGGVGLTISGDVGRVVTNRFGSTSSLSKPFAFGGGVRLGLPFISVGAMAAVYDPKITNQGNEQQYAGTAALKVFGGPLIPLSVSLQAGVGYLKVGSGTGATSNVSIPIGIGVALNVPTPGASIAPWVAARVQVNSVSTGGGIGNVSQTQLGFGTSGGLNIGTPAGLGFHVAFDWATFGGRPSSPITSLRDRRQLLTVGGGVHYTLKIPGLVPIVPGV